MSKSNYKEEVSCIDGVQFGLLSSEEILRRSCAHVNDATLYDSNGEPKLGGLFDPRMGVIERKKDAKLVVKIVLNVQDILGILN